VNEFVLVIWLLLDSGYHSSLYIEFFSFPYKLNLDSIVKDNSNLIGTNIFLEDFKKFVPIFLGYLHKHFRTEWLNLLKTDKRSALVQLSVKVFFTQNSSPTFRNVSASSPMGLISSLYLWKRSPE